MYPSREHALSQRFTIMCTAQMAGLTQKLQRGTLLRYIDKHSAFTRLVRARCHLIRSPGFFTDGHNACDVVQETIGDGVAFFQPCGTVVCKPDCAFVILPDKRSERKVYRRGWGGDHHRCPRFRVPENQKMSGLHFQSGLRGVSAVVDAR